MLACYGRNRGPVHREVYGVLFISTVDCLHGLLFIHRRPPPASTCDCSSTGSCSSSLHRALLHRLLFNQPSPWAPVQSPLHGLLYIHPSTVYCSSSPPRGRPVHPALNGVLFIQPQPTRSGSYSSRGNTTGSCSSTPTGTCSSKPPSNAHYSSRGIIDRLQLAAVAKESLDRSGSVTRSLQCNCSGSVGERLARVQLEPNASHPRTYVYKRNTHRSALNHPP